MSAPNTVALIVISDRLQREVIQMALNRSGIDTVHVPRPREVEDYIEKYRPAVLILDIFLQQVNGLELLRGLKERKRLNGLPVIVVSSLGFKEVIQQAALAGARYFMVKPVDTDLLVERVQKLMPSDDLA
ncbi:MAG: response regulator [Chloroflexi bacterium]|jgi:DNA-binding response OmpR family regulator|nr:response regulator [Anaerolineaceae bacterium]NMB87689.1 response regulator [Chloroflexota bacterium]